LAVPVALVPHTPASFRLAVAVRADPARMRSDVLAAASDRLATTFSFAARDLGQAVAASEVLAVIQAVPGVIAATVTALWKVDPAAPSAIPTTSADLLAAGSPSPGVEIGTIAGAELIVLDPSPITWKVLP
jgi:hypothetical protein